MKLELKEAIENWFELDKNEDTRKEAESVVASGDLQELERRFLTFLSFGTAGLRGCMGAGFGCIDDLTVIQASQGVCRHVENSFGPAGYNRGVVIGYDHRNNSTRFARLAAAAFLHAGFKVYLFESIVFTPLVSFAVTHFQACCGIMVTASHNPKQDNGYKVYWENGAQITSPHDKKIAELITQNRIPWTWDKDLRLNNAQCIDPLNDVCNHYFGKLKSLCRHKDDNKNSGIQVVYTPMHGVGLSFAQRAFECFNLPMFIPVTQQMLPDPEFPTVKYPNPEEGEGALSLAFQTANDHQSPLIFANDPDADRFAVAERSSANDFYIFTGNQLGILFANYLWESFKNHPTPGEPAMLCSTVSSRMMHAMSLKEGFHFEETLSGFKWLANKAIELENKGFDVLFAFEEAIGYMCGTLAMDKDGISALAVFGELSAQLYLKGKTLQMQLNELYERYGYFITNNSYYICHSPKVIETLFNVIRYGNDIHKDDFPRSHRLFSRDGKSYTLRYPMKLGEFEVAHVRDLTVGFDSHQSNGNAILPISSSSQMMTFYFTNNAIVTLRTSGTEPKIKYYIELMGNWQERQQSHDELDRLSKAVIVHLLRPHENGIIAKE